MKNSVLNRSLMGLIFFLAVLQLSARTLGHGTLTGSLRDGDTKEPIPYSNVVLLRATDHRLAAVGTTDARGNFRFARVPLGSYIVQTTILGYQPLRPSVAFSPLSSRQKLGSLTLRSLPCQATVVGKRQLATPQRCTQPPKMAVTNGSSAERQRS